MKSYLQFCGLAKALDVLGERWTLLLVRELLLGPRRYTDLLASLPGITTNLLAARLQRLEELEVVARDADGRWQLTASGAAIEPAIMELARWGGRFLSAPRRGERVDLAWGLLSLKRRYRGGLDLVLAVDLGGTWFTLGFQPSYLLVRKQRPERAAATLHLTPDAARALLFAEAPLAPLLESGAASIDGAHSPVERALRSLLPPPLRQPPPLHPTPITPVVVTVAVGVTVAVAVGRSEWSRETSRPKPAVQDQDQDPVHVGVLSRARPSFSPSQRLAPSA